MNGDKAAGHPYIRKSNKKIFMFHQKTRRYQDQNKIRSILTFMKSFNKSYLLYLFKKKCYNYKPVTFSHATTPQINQNDTFHST